MSIWSESHEDLPLGGHVEDFSEESSVDASLRVTIDSIWVSDEINVIVEAIHLSLYSNVSIGCWAGIVNQASLHLDLFLAVPSIRAGIRIWRFPTPLLEKE